MNNATLPFGTPVDTATRRRRDDLVGRMIIGRQAKGSVHHLLTSSSDMRNKLCLNQVVFLDQWWNPAVMEQAAARVHRIGQTRTCYVTTLIARNTIDERIMTILQRKKRLFDLVVSEIREGRTPEADIESLAKALTLNEMLEALGLSAA